MMAWLERRLGDARAAGQRIWLVHHIPVGIDPYATLQAPARVELSGASHPLSQRALCLALRAASSGICCHHPGRLFRPHPSRQLSPGDGCRVAVGVEKVAPSISPIFGNNPGFHVLNYDRQTGDVIDFSTWYLANLDQASGTTPGEWKRSTSSPRPTVSRRIRPPLSSGSQRPCWGPVEQVSGFAAPSVGFIRLVTVRSLLQCCQPMPVLSAIWLPHPTPPVTARGDW